MTSINAYSQYKHQSQTEEIIKAIDSDCVRLMIEAKAATITEYNAKACYENNALQEKIPYDTYIEIIKKTSKAFRPIAFVQDSFKKIKLMTYESADSFRRLNNKFDGLFGATSQPMFDDKKQFAMVEYSKGCGEYWSNCVYLLKKTKNTWAVIQQFECWIN